MTAPILFLDIDGVLNSSEWVRRRTELGLSYPRSVDGTSAALASAARWQLDPDAIARLNRVTDQTGARIVVSSAWRLGSSSHWAGVRYMLAYRGVDGTIVGRTPWEHGTRSYIILGKERGDEISAWLDAHPEVTNFAIVDDHEDMGVLKARLVRTDFETGLQDRHVDRLVEMLGGQA